MALNLDEAHAVDAALAYLAGIRSDDDGARLLGHLRLLAQSSARRLDGDPSEGDRWFDEHKEAICENLERLRGPDWL